MFKPALKFALIFSLVLSSLTSILHATLLENIPLDSWVYPVVDELYSQGLFPKLHKNVKPYTRGEIASLVLDINLKQSEGSLKLTDSQLWLLSKLNSEFKYELEELYYHKQKEDHTVWRYGISPITYSHVVKDDNYNGRVQIGFESGIQFDNKFVLKDRVMIDTKTEEERRYKGIEWKHDLTGVLSEAYANFDLRYFQLLLGREHLRWGPGNNDVLLLSDQIPPFDMVKIEGKLGSFKLIWFATVLDQIYVYPQWMDFQPVYGYWAKRYLSGHRLNLKLKMGLEMGLAEVILYGGKDRLPEPYYLNPILPYYGEQYNHDIDDNILWSFDFSLSRYKNKEFYFELLVDDFQYDFKSEPHQTGYRLGLNYADPFGFKRSLVNLEYTKINNWVYGQNKPWNIYTYQGLGMGSILGPDADRWSLSVLHHFTKDLDFVLLEEYIRKGEGRINTSQAGVVPSSKKFPSGIVEYINKIKFTATYQPDSDFKIDLSGEYEKIKNQGNQCGRNEDTVILQAKLSLFLWKEKEF